MSFVRQLHICKLTHFGFRDINALIKMLKFVIIVIINFTYNIYLVGIYR